MAEVLRVEKLIRNYYKPSRTEEKQDGMIIYGGKPKGARIDGANDHRIVMAAAVGAAFAEGESTIIGAEAINKSYPEFFDDFKKIGGKAI